MLAGIAEDQNKCIRLIIADDHAIIRYALKTIIEANDMQVAAEAINDQGLFDLLNAINYDLIIINVSLSRHSPLPAFLKTINKKRKKFTPILVYNLSSDIFSSASVLSAGASAYLTKNCGPEQYIEAIQKIAHGGKYVSPDIAEKILFSPIKQAMDLSPEQLLTQREYQVFLKLLESKTIESIAADLSISRQTVGTHKTRLMRKLGIQNSVDIIRYAMHHGLLAY